MLVYINGWGYWWFNNTLYQDSTLCNQIQITQLTENEKQQLNNFIKYGN